MPDPINLVGFFFCLAHMLLAHFEILTTAAREPGICQLHAHGVKNLCFNKVRPTYFFRGELARQIDGLARSMHALNHGLAGQVRAKLSG